MSWPPPFPTGIAPIQANPPQLQQQPQPVYFYSIQPLQQPQPLPQMQSQPFPLNTIQTGLFLPMQQPQEQKQQSSSQPGGGRAATRYNAPKVAPYPSPAVSSSAAASAPPAAKVPAVLLAAIGIAPDEIRDKFDLIVSRGNDRYADTYAQRQDVSKWLRDRNLLAALRAMNSTFPPNPPKTTTTSVTATSTAQEMAAANSGKTENSEVAKKLKHLISTGSLGRCFQLGEDSRSRYYFLGSACLRYHVSRMMEMKTAFAMPYLLTQMRSVVLSNENVAKAHDVIGLYQLLNGESKEASSGLLGTRQKVENLTLVLAELEEMANPVLDSGMRSLRLNGNTNGSEKQHQLAALAKDARDGIISIVLSLGDELFHRQQPVRMARLAQSSSSGNGKT
eukprot:TRINITY_DN599_c0_g1_i1.p1 TRINITY_DN599_c0_g1~~TRINITY_DN599_c0_g1_i1.p1  ORF type:complete len:392 (-),score=64.51 TRINITY_DN599_c0_g1_i1:1104-2279(-)